MFNVMETALSPSPSPNPKEAIVYLRELSYGDMFEAEGCPNQRFIKLMGNSQLCLQDIGPVKPNELVEPPDWVRYAVQFGNFLNGNVRVTALFGNVCNVTEEPIEDEELDLGRSETEAKKKKKMP